MLLQIFKKKFKIKGDIVFYLEEGLKNWNLRKFKQYIIGKISKENLSEMKFEKQFSLI